MPHFARKLRKVPPLRVAEFLDFVRAQPCIICGVGPSEPHHFGPRGMGQKTDDLRAVPLCTSCHRAWHDRGEICPYTPTETRFLFLSGQVDLLVEWYRRQDEEVF